MDYQMAKFSDLYTIHINGSTLEITDLAEALPNVPVLTAEAVANAVAKVSRRSIDIPYEELPKPEYKEYLSCREVCDVFPSLAYNNVKSRLWRRQQGFPTIQQGRKCRVLFSYTEVKEWIKTHSS